MATKFGLGVEIQLPSGLSGSFFIAVEFLSILPFSVRVFLSGIGMRYSVSGFK